MPPLELLSWLIDLATFDAGIRDQWIAFVSGIEVEACSRCSTITTAAKSCGRIRDGHAEWLFDEGEPMHDPAAVTGVFDAVAAAVSKAAPAEPNR